MLNCIYESSIVYEELYFMKRKKLTKNPPLLFFMSFYENKVMFPNSIATEIRREIAMTFFSKLVMYSPSGIAV